MPPRVTVIEIRDTMMLFEMIKQQRKFLARARNQIQVIHHQNRIRLYQGGIEMYMWELRQ